MLAHFFPIPLTPLCNYAASMRSHNPTSTAEQRIPQCRPIPHIYAQGTWTSVHAYPLRVHRRGQTTSSIKGQKSLTSTTIAHIHTISVTSIEWWLLPNARTNTQALYYTLTALCICTMDKPAFNSSIIFFSRSSAFPRGRRLTAGRRLRSNGTANAVRMLLVARLCVWLGFNKPWIDGISWRSVICNRRKRLFSSSPVGD